MFKVSFLEHVGRMLVKMSDDVDSYYTYGITYEIQWKFRKLLFYLSPGECSQCSQCPVHSYPQVDAAIYCRMLITLRHRHRFHHVDFRFARPLIH